MEAILREVKLLRTELSKDIVMLREDIKDHEVRIRKLETPLRGRRWVDCEIETKSLSSEQMITVYQDHIEELEDENQKLKAQLDFLNQQLEYKTLGLPNDETDMQAFISIGRSQR